MLNILIFYFLRCCFGYADAIEHEPIVLEGKTMGTTYRVIYFDQPRGRNFSHSVDSLLGRINQAISTYDSSAEISRFNRSAKGICVELPYLYDVLKRAKKVNARSDGAFDPTVMPLVNAWGFGPNKSGDPSPSEIDSLKELTGLHRIKLSRKRIIKRDPRIQLDMGGIGQGYGADMIFDLLRSRGIEHMLVELGGEGICRGKNLSKNKPWTVGILDPNSTPDNQFFKAYVSLQDRAFTTSGNYFNYRVIGGRKFGHTIDPVTGYPVQHSLLSASVFADDCTSADAWATAFMVMGLEKSMAKVKSLEGIDVLFIYANKEGRLETFMTAGIKNEITLEQ